MNWSAWLKMMVPLTLAAGFVWFLALLSHQSGNTTAVNALVGIPMGLVLGAAFAAAITWGTDY